MTPISSAGDSGGSRAAASRPLCKEAVPGGSHLAQVGLSGLEGVLPSRPSRSGLRMRQLAARLARLACEFLLATGQFLDPVRAPFNRRFRSPDHISPFQAVLLP